MEILIGILICLLVFYYFRKWNKSETSLPEPLTLPIFGHMFFLGVRHYHKLTKWAKSYGKIYKLKLGTLDPLENTFRQSLLATISCREAFNMPSFSGRMDAKVFNTPSDGKNGIVSSDGHVWTEQRRFAIRNLRDFGFGRKSMENMIMEEVNETIEGFLKDAGKPVIVQRKFSLAVLNSLWQIVAGSRYSHDDPKLNDLLTLANDTFAEASVNPIVSFFPSIAEIFPKISGWKTFQDVCTTLLNFYKQQIKEHKSTFEDNNPRDLIDNYLEEINKTSDPSSSFYKETGEKHLAAVISDMFIAGSETTSSTLQWAVLYLCKYDHMQKKFRSEIEKVVGKTKLPSLDDRSNMPYTEALIMEILRKSSIVPTGLMHCTLADTTFHGYLIPKGYGILANTYGVHHDLAIWKDPENFRPERFIDENGQCIRKHESLLAFSVGKRACVGESLARDTIFLFLTSIFQRFEVTLADKNATMDAKIGFILSPQPFKVIFNEL